MFLRAVARPSTSRIACLDAVPKPEVLHSNTLNLNLTSHTIENHECTENLHNHTANTNHELLHRDIAQLNSLISSYIRRGDPFSAWTLFCCMRRGRSDLDAYTFTSALRACSVLAVSEVGKQVHTQMIRTGADSGTVVKTALLDMYFRCGGLDESVKVFEEMRRVRSDLDAYTFTSVLRACSLLPVSELGKQVHSQMIRTGADSGTVAKTALLDMYSRCGCLDESVKVFEEMRHKDVVAWNALLSCFLRQDLPGEALGVLRAMGRENVEFSEFTLCSVLKCCASLKALELGRQVHGLVVSMGRDLVVLSTVLIDFYSSVGCIDDALKVFYSLKDWKDDNMHNSLVSGCIRNRRYDEVFKALSLMKPNAVALTSALVGCSENLDLQAGRQIHCVAVRQGFTFETQLCNALLNMYSKCGKILNAQLLFDRISQKDVVSLTCMIDAYGRNGQGCEAVELFQKMIEGGSTVLPNSLTFLSVLSACDHSGLVEEGKKCFNLMREKYGLEPDPEHYACFIDILGRAGKIEEVWSVYQNMIEQGTRPTAGVWIQLLNACSLNQDVERGEFAAKHLLELEPNKASNIVLVSNFYAAIDRWDLVDDLRSIMRTKGFVKEAGNSWISVQGFNRHARSLSA